MQKREKGVVTKNWLLLDSQSMVDQVSNPALMKNIRKAASAVTVHCNAGSTSTKRTKLDILNAPVEERISGCNVVKSDIQKLSMLQ